MLNNFIGGGQVFLHKVRMFRQVLRTTVFVSLVTGIILAWSFYHQSSKQVDIDGAFTYVKAQIVITVHPALSAISIGKSRPVVDAYSNGKIWQKSMSAYSVINSGLFKTAWNTAINEAKIFGLKSLVFGSGVLLVVFIIWSYFGSNLKNDKKKEGSGEVLTPLQVKLKLQLMSKDSNLCIGNMPLVKDSETRHFLIMGSTGSGKTNLVHNLLPQVKQKDQTAIIIDQTGEIIARYYNPERGDIIFNPFDGRSKSWDFWQDCSTSEELERFSKILFSFNRKRSRSYSDPFWEQSAQYVFNSCAEYLIRTGNTNLTALKLLAIEANLDELRKKLKGTAAERYLTDDGKGVASSVLSTLATSAKPISYLPDDNTNGTFSLKEHFENIKSGSNAWLFLSTKPSSRELTLPLIACLTELALSKLMDIGIDQRRRVWCVFDELASLGNLPALSPLMAEGRKYGACVVAALQSLNQIYDHYGAYAGSSIFGQFGTCFFFRNTEPAIAKMFSSMCGTETITRQQKNTSFGANDFRDGVSYQETEKKKELVEYNELASLAVGECYTLLPEPKVRLSKIQIPQDKGKDITQGFIQK
jgi:type IV conjugative transfer system coupling protein TraD